MEAQRPPQSPVEWQTRDYLSQQPTIPSPVVNPSPPLLPPDQQRLPWQHRFKRPLGIVLILALALIIYLIWRPSSQEPPAPAITQQNFDPSQRATSTNTTGTNGSIQVYVVGAIKRPGVYRLAANARVHQLLTAAGGPQPDANLVAINLAAKLNDGEEVYVTTIGETPPTYVGGVPGPEGGNTTNSHLININTANVEELRQSLRLSATTAQNIVNYRLQHGPFTSVDQLAQIVSKSIYTRIKDLVTIQ